MCIKLKVCGLKVTPNLKQVASINPDYLGFITYNKSKRYVSNDNWEQLSQELVSLDVKTVGVFVNSDLLEISSYMRKEKFDVLQLHGEETKEFCTILKEEFNCEIWKVIHVDSNTDLNGINSYSNVVDMFLFDTKTVDYGGSGKSFNWKLLKDYKFNKNYMLSGGISPENIENAIEFVSSKEQCVGIDVNSGYEDSPGIKNIEKLKILSKQLTGVR